MVENMERRMKSIRNHIKKEKELYVSFAVDILHIRGTAPVVVALHTQV